MITTPKNNKYMKEKKNEKEEILKFKKRETFSNILKLECEFILNIFKSLEVLNITF